MKIAVDGVAGAGKSTVARLLAERLGILYVNTGAMYRAMAWAAQAGLPLNEVEIDLDAEAVRVNGKQIGEALYNAELDLLASQLATRAQVRDRLIDQQRWIAAKQDVVMEGRDIGTVVLPDADLKLYLTASLDVRTRRRARQRGEDEHAVRQSLEARDARDREGFGRQRAPDAVVVDTSDLSVESVVDKVLASLKKKAGAGNL